MKRGRRYYICDSCSSDSYPSSTSDDCGSDSSSDSEHEVFDSFFDSEYGVYEGYDSSSDSDHEVYDSSSDSEHEVYDISSDSELEVSNHSQRHKQNDRPKKVFQNKEKDRGRSHYEKCHKGKAKEMTTVDMCFSSMQTLFESHTSASYWGENLQSLSRSGGNTSSYKLLGSRASVFEGQSSRCVGRSKTTETRGKKSSMNSKRSNIKPKISDGTILTSTTLDVNKSGIGDFNKDLAPFVTAIVFDIETTGLSRENERIIEIALQDLQGGRNSTFQSLVNPERYVPNSHIHGIANHMVNRAEVPRMKEVIPMLLQYVKSRQKPKKKVVLIAHNGHCFDVPFLIHEFSRCSYKIPRNWLFLDTLHLAREVKKSTGSKASSSLQALREHYGIPLVGSAHRAMSDVNSLSLILQRLTLDLKLSFSGLLERTFRASDLIKLKTKKISLSKKKKIIKKKKISPSKNKIVKKKKKSSPSKNKIVKKKKKSSPSKNKIIKKKKKKS